MKINFFNKLTTKPSCLIIGLSEEIKPQEQFNYLNNQIISLINNTINKFDFHYKKNEILPIISSDELAIIVIGLGKKQEIDQYSLMSFGGKVVNLLNNYKIDQAHIILDNYGQSTAEYIAYGALLRNYKFDKYKTKNEETKKNIEALNIYTESNDTEEKFKILKQIASGVFLTRNLVSEPPNVIYPESFVTTCEQAFNNSGITIEILHEADLKKLGMGALLGVAQGSSKEPKVMIMRWQGADDKAEAPLAFVGKGVTFDTGGISLKPSEGMDSMKYDMAGAGVVAGLMKSLSARKAKINAVGIVGLVENMPDGNAQRPGDVVKSLSGQTIEILNTDAEGRLVLADILWYCQDKFKPKFIIDLATLTGAIVVTFGSLYSGLFSNNDKLAEQIILSGQKTNEKTWRLPISKEYDKQIDSKVADMQNIGNAKGAGSITAAQFLQRFVNETPWAHIDIAGVAWAKKDLDFIVEGATGYGVRLLDHLIKEFYEKQ